MKRNYRSTSPSHIDDDDDTSTMLQDLKTLRKLKAKQQGLSADVLLRASKQPPPSTLILPDNDGFDMKEGGMVDMDKLKQKDRNESSLISGFTTTNKTLDANKHMRKFIEREMNKMKRGESTNNHTTINLPKHTTTTTSNSSTTMDQELYLIPERLKVEKKQVQEGSAGVSSAMLTAIAEVDLGISSKLNNIERTEQAKQLLINKLIQIKSKKLKQQSSSFNHDGKQRRDTSLHYTHAGARWRMTREMRESAALSSTLNNALTGDDNDLDYLNLAEEVITSTTNDDDDDTTTTNDATTIDLEKRIEQSIRERIVRAELEHVLGKDLASDEVVADRFKKRQKR